MSDEQRSGMEPDELVKPRGAKDSAPDEPGSEDTEGDGGKLRPDKMPVQPAPEDTEGHGIKFRGAKDEAPDEPGGEDAAEDDDVEGHRAFYSSDRNVKRDVTPVVW